MQLLSHRKVRIKYSPKSKPNHEGINSRLGSGMSKDTLQRKKVLFKICLCINNSNPGVRLQPLLPSCFKPTWKNRLIKLTWKCQNQGFPDQRMSHPNYHHAIRKADQLLGTLIWQQWSRDHSNSLVCYNRPEVKEIHKPQIFGKNYLMLVSNLQLAERAKDYE